MHNSLEYLRHLLSNLPNTVPHSGNLYDFRNFAPDPDAVEKYESREAAVNHALEIAFSPLGRRDGPCPFDLLDQGPGLVAVVDVLRDFLVETPGSAVLRKWVEDFTKAAVFQFESVQIPVSDGSVYIESRKKLRSYALSCSRSLRCHQAMSLLTPK